MSDLAPLWLSLKVAGVAILVIIPVGTLVSWWLAFGPRFRGKAFVEGLVSLPLVLPPTVTGYYLLSVFGRGTGLGRWVNDSVGIRLVFTWEGAAIASAVMGFPLFVRTVTSAFASIDDDILQAGRSLGATELVLLARVVIPLTYRGMIAGSSLAFARALGEFGATAMIAGSIPGETQTLPLALYDAVESGANSQALTYTLLLSLTGFSLVGAASLYQGLVSKGRGERR